MFRGWKTSLVQPYRLFTVDFLKSSQLSSQLFPPKILQGLHVSRVEDEPRATLLHTPYRHVVCTVCQFHILNIYCAVLYFTVLYCIILYCTVLYSTVQNNTIQYCTLLYCTVLYCNVLYCTVL